MKSEKIPMFKPFDNIGVGFDRLFEKIETITDASDRTELIVIYGCLAQTVNEQINHHIHDGYIDNVENGGEDHAK
jgi:hypothetical protein